MEPTWVGPVISGGAGLVGALVGASAALGGKWIDAHHARKAERQRQSDELLAQFWEITDRMWRLHKEAHEISVDRDRFPVGVSRDPDEDDEITEEEDLNRRRRWTAAYEGAREANIEAGVLLGRLRLLGLDIAEPAATLRQASAYYHYNEEPRLSAKRKEALDAYEKAASRLMTS